MAEHTSTFDESQEQWRPVVGLEGFYAVSSIGRVKRVGRIRSVLSGKPLHPTLSTTGYTRIHLTIGRHRKMYQVHRLVAEAFIGPCPPDRRMVNHKNAIKTDNRVENLEYVSPAGNMQHALSMGLIKGPRGEKSGNVVLRETDIPEIRKLLSEGMRPHHIAQRYGVQCSTISCIRNGRTWKHVA